MSIFRRLLEGISAEGSAALVSITGVEGSSPRNTGTHMVVRRSGGFHGTIGGGALEWMAIEDAQRALQRGRGPAIFTTKSLGPDLGQCCGGRVQIRIETFASADVASLTELAEAEHQGLVTFLARGGADGRILRRADDASRLKAPHEISEIFGEVPSVLYLFGAGHVGRAMVLALAALPFKVMWIDSRDDIFPAAVPDNTQPIFSSDPVAELQDAPAEAFVLVMTHSHPLDLAITAKALEMRRFSYVGLIGSGSKRARFLNRMREMGLDEPAIAALTCPIGLAGVDDKAPAVIAAATTAQLLMRREAVARLANPAQTPDADHGTE